VSVKEFASAFQSFHVGRAVANELAVPFDKSKNHPAALTTSRYGVSAWELFKANIYREMLLMKRNSFVYIFRTLQVIRNSISNILPPPFQIISHFDFISLYLDA